MRNMCCQCRTSPDFLVAVDVAVGLHCLSAVGHWIVADLDVDAADVVELGVDAAAADAEQCGTAVVAEGLRSGVDVAGVESSVAVAVADVEPYVAVAVVAAVALGRGYGTAAVVQESSAPYHGITAGSEVRSAPGYGLELGCDVPESGSGSAHKDSASGSG